MAKTRPTGKQLPGETRRDLPNFQAKGPWSVAITLEPADGGKITAFSAFRTQADAIEAWESARRACRQMAELQDRGFGGKKDGAKN